MFSPLISIEELDDLSGFSKVPKICNKVVLPTPEGPVIDMISFF
jgi:hypothetical protein